MNDAPSQIDAVHSDMRAMSTAQLTNAVTALEKLFDQRVGAIEKAVEVAHANLVRVPTEVDKAVGHLSALISEKLAIHAEKFSSVQTQFQERDIRTEQTARDSKVAVDAALQAAKEAVGKQQEASDRAIAKSEAAVTKQIDQIVVLIQTNNVSTDGKIIDLKERLTLWAGKSEGLSAGWAILIGVVGIIGALAGIVAVVMSK